MPIALKTRRKASGRSQAAVNAQIAPLLAPPMQRSLPSFDSRIGRPSARRLLLHFGQQLLEQEAGVVVAQAVVFVAAVEAVERLVGGRLDPAVHDEDADGDRHFLLVDQLVEDRRRVVLNAVLIDVDAGRLGRVVLLRHVDPVVADGAGEDLALVEGVLGHFALGHVGRRIRVVAAEGQGRKRLNRLTSGARNRMARRMVGILAGRLRCVSSGSAQVTILAETGCDGQIAPILL